MSDGWKCPSCLRDNAPWVPACPGPHGTVTASTEVIFWPGADLEAAELWRMVEELHEAGRVVLYGVTPLTGSRADAVRAVYARMKEDSDGK